MSYRSDKLQAQNWVQILKLNLEVRDRFRRLLNGPRTVIVLVVKWPFYSDHVLSVKSWSFLIPRVAGRSDYLPLDSGTSNIVDPETSAGKAILYQCSRATFPDAILNKGFHIPSSSGCWLNVHLSDNVAINSCLVSLFDCKGLTLSFWIHYENSRDDQNIMELSNGGIRVLAIGSGGASPSTSI